MSLHRHTTPSPFSTLLVCALSCALAAQGGRATADAGSAARLAPVVARILSYERTLPTRAGPTVDLVLLYAAGSATSQAEANAYATALSTMSGATIQGLPVRASAVAFSGANLSSAIGAGADVIVVCTGLESQLAAIAQLARARRVLTVGLTRGNAQQATSIAVVLEDGRPKILAHLGHARAEGVQFSSQLLRLCEML